MSRMPSLWEKVLVGLLPVFLCSLSHLEFPTSRGHLLWPPQPGWLCLAATLPCAGAADSADLTQPLRRAE